MNRFPLCPLLLTAALALPALAVAQGRPPSTPPHQAPAPAPAPAPPPPATGLRPGQTPPKTPMPAVGSQRPDTGHNPPGARPGQPSPAPEKPAAPAKAVKVKATLECSTTRIDGTAIKLPARQVRLEAPIKCVLNAGQNTGGAGLTGAIRVVVGGKVRKAHEGPLAGAGNASMQQELANGDDYESCMNFTIAAEVHDAAGKTVGKKSIKVKQFCPD
jgi:hypothetical protein